MSAPESPAWLTPAQAAEHLGMSAATFYTHLAQRHFPFAQITRKVGGRWKVSAHLLAQFDRGELEEADAA